MAHIFSSAIMSNTTLVILLLCLAESCRAKNSSLCITSSCGNINISYPFRLRGDPADCGHPDSFYALECQKNRLILHTESRRYHVEAITYSNFSIRISDPGLDSNNISSCPIYSYINNDIYSNYEYTYYTSSIYITFINCLSPVANPLYVENPFCGNTSAFSNASRIYSYVTTESILLPDLEESCTYDTMAQASLIWPSTDHHNYSYAQIHDLLAYGFELLWYPALCTECDDSKGTCSLEGNKIRCHHYCYESTPFKDPTFICKLEYYAVYLYIAALAIGGIIALRYVIGIPCIIGMVVIGRKRQRSWMNNSENMEELMRHQFNHMPIHYSYREIKKMTQNFKAKLGGGPHGTVFRGKLRSGPIVAVKMLTISSSSSDKEFIRRASEISRISNANVVKLFGFCIEGKRRALVHEFVQCGSLERHISLQKERGLSCGETFKITIGIARGIQCLHSANILHLAIKPQNILLDEYLNPKISVERFQSSQFKGKMGFLAPEMLYKNIGGEVSCKADVYSFGTLVLEMAAQLQGELGEEVYFPLWIYKQLCEGKELEMRDGGEEEKEMMKKMTVAGLWCIQIKAGDRPMMEQVVAMLQGGLELLHLPPMPFHHSQEFIMD